MASFCLILSCKTICQNCAYTSLNGLTCEESNVSSNFLHLESWIPDHIIYVFSSDGGFIGLLLSSALRGTKLWLYLTLAPPSAACICSFGSLIELHDLKDFLRFPRRTIELAFSAHNLMDIVFTNLSLHTFTLIKTQQAFTRRSPCMLKLYEPYNYFAATAHGRSKRPACFHFTYPTIRNGSAATSIQAVPAVETKAAPSVESNSLIIEGTPQPTFFEVSRETDNMKKWIQRIKVMLRSMKDGEISISAYDTSWVARVPALDNRSRPQFPKCLDWIVQNQLQDGSWGDKEFFLAYDRICSTMGCLIALKTWNVGHQHIERGLKFVWSNMEKMEQTGTVHMPIGFEITFLTLMEDAKEFCLHLPYDFPIVKRLEQEKEKKLKRIPLDIVHESPTTLLHSLEGLHKLIDWNRVIPLQAKNGSFLFSPASTACALKYTGDLKCLEYLTCILEKFGNAVPNVYPVDIFERVWIVDRLQRLGISRYFEAELKECLDYVYRYWTTNGIAWARDSPVQDIDDTAMAFRLLRLKGYDVSPDVFRQFKKNNEFFCFAGQTSQALTGMYNLYRASQTLFPGETILQEARTFASNFLEAKQKEDALFDKWIIARGLNREVDYALRFPWYASLPRIETSEYLSQYGPDDVWIGKTLYKMPYVNNQTFLDLAKADFSFCQHIHQNELEQVKRWHKGCKFDKLSDSYRQNTTECYFSVAATVFEPELASARLVWAKCSVLATLLDDFFDVAAPPQELRAFLEAIKRWDVAILGGCSETARILFMGLYNTLNAISQEAEVLHGRHVSSHVKEAWMRFVTCMMTEAEWRASRHIPSMQEYMDVAEVSIGLEAIVLPSLLFLGLHISHEIITHQDHQKVMHLLGVSGRLLNDIRSFQRESRLGKHSSVTLYLRQNPSATKEEAMEHLKCIIDGTMQQLVREVLRPTAVPWQCKQLHLSMAKVLNLFYLKTDGHTSPTEVKGHVERVLFAGAGA